jgi:hypothetical protein
LRRSFHTLVAGASGTSLRMPTHDEAEVAEAASRAFIERVMPSLYLKRLCEARPD